MDPNGKMVYTYGDIEDDIKSETPQEDCFDDCYQKEDIERDKQRVRAYKAQSDIVDSLEIPSSRIQEYATEQEIGEMDWFGEEKREEELFEDGKGQQTFSILTSEFDDYMNHIDAICVMNNSKSGYKPLPFSLDITYNVDPEKLDKKMSWEHRAAKIPGFATAKYFEDTFSCDSENKLKKGRIEIMPRFVIGYSPSLSEEITSLRKMSNGAQSTRRDILSNRAKWCFLKELSEQADQMLNYLEDHHNESDLLEKAFNDVKCLKEYFDGAIEVARAADEPNHEYENYVYKDEVAATILSKSIYGYLKN